ncbi:uncharacterized protein BP5553_00951 [Venustampulla echinocandica]|uniref:Major facilitator superfamily (MFS) profile domain-containing protein n=1 Tax=Venustampulla echinocandica TaxID=2656787 RepID=A0A370TZK9_9HELO|nr:uncharacterized protein BP5553_00951 [Venustampulla echinocandica]RDL40972.1 hypothetical protein BP5553_00951 [Venustampulla echinocandica]
MIDSNSEKEGAYSTGDSLALEDIQASTMEGKQTTAESTSDVPTQEQEPEYITGVKLFVVLVGCGMVVFLMQLDQTIVVTAIPRITSTFNSLKDIGWYGSSFMLALAAVQPLAGKVYQYYSSKYTFLSAIAIFEVGSLICAVSQSSNMFIVGRAIAGAGGSGLALGFFSILAASAPLDKRPLYLGIVMGVASLGLVLGPVIGGVLTERASWRVCFYLNLPVGALTASFLSFITIPDSKLSGGPKKATIKEQLARLDLQGFAIFTPTCIMLLLALEWGGVTYKWDSATIIGLFCGAVVLCGLFLLWERYRGTDAMIPLAMLRRPVMISASTTMVMSQASTLVITYYLAIWFQVVKEASPTMGGVYFLPTVGSQIVGAVVTGALTSRLGFYTPFAIAGSALTTVASGLFTTLTPTSSAGAWIGYQIISGLSRGMSLQQPITAIQAVLPKEELALGNAFLMFSQILAAAIFVSLGQTIFSNHLVSALAKFAPEVDALRVLDVGATNFRSVIAVESVPGVILAYNQSITRIFWLSLGASCAGFVASWFLGWKNIKKIKQGDEKQGCKAAEKGDAEV